MSGGDGPGGRAWGALAACVALLVLAVGLRAAWFGVPDRSPDEKLYAEFGSHIADQGLAWFPRMVRAYTTGHDVEYPWVHRAGFLSAVALAQLATGRDDPVAGELLSSVASVATIALAGALAWSLLGPWCAVLTLLFLAVSPLDLALARRAWQDDLVALVTLVIVALLLEALGRPGERRWRVAFFAVSGFSLLVKESALLPFGFGTLALAVADSRRARDARRALPPLAWGAATTAIVVGAVVALAGGMRPLLKLIAMTPEAWAPDAYLREYQTGGIGYYVTGLRILQPVPWVLGVVAAALAMVGALAGRWRAGPGPGAPRPLVGGLLAVPWRSASGSRALGWLGGYVLFFLAVSCAYGSKNMRFLSPLYAPVAMLAAALVVATLGRLRASVPLAAWRGMVVAVAAALLLAAWADARRFDHYFNELQIQDLATPWFTKADAGTL